MHQNAIFNTFLNMKGVLKSDGKKGQYLRRGKKSKEPLC